ncbi:hypothetical protein ACQUSR_00555 [Streptomyces sp. P1-3]|uniref:hypothetical protein n=1 Tax=Streptomyces sp. P1-3 TaxID=3421658 RepID=UPI003D36D2C0
MTATVRLVRLSCEETEDSGDDEIRMNYNGEVVLFATMNAGDGTNLNVDRRIDGEAVVDLQEEDFPDDDDFLGRIVIRESEKGQGTRHQAFTLDEAHYTLFYEVR